MVPAFAEEDILQVMESPIREKILNYLTYVPGSVSVSALSKAIDEKSGNVNYHCDELGEPNRNLVEIIKTKKKYVRLTEKGRLVWQEVKRRNEANEALVVKKLSQED